MSYKAEVRRRLPRAFCLQKFEPPFGYVVYNVRDNESVPIGSGNNAPAAWRKALENYENGRIE